PPQPADELADQPLRITRAVRGGGVDQGAAGVAESLQQTPGLLGARVPSPGHGAEPQPRDFQPADPDGASFHAGDLNGHAHPPGATTVTGMRLGLNLGYLVSSEDGAGQLRLARQAEILGFSVVWASGAYGSDRPTVFGS